jgi:hypothetical protein
MPKKIKANIFNDMKEALKDAAAYERGEPSTCASRASRRAPSPFLPKKSATSAKL